MFKKILMILVSFLLFWKKFKKENTIPEENILQHILVLQIIKHRIQYLTSFNSNKKKCMKNSWFEKKYFP